MSHDNYNAPEGPMRYIDDSLNKEKNTFSFSMKRAEIIPSESGNNSSNLLQLLKIRLVFNPVL